PPKEAIQRDSTPPTSPTTAGQPQPAAPPPPEKNFAGWVDGISTHTSGITVMLNRNADGTGSDKIWLLMSDSVGKLVDADLVPYLEEFKRAQSNRLYVDVMYRELPYRKLVTSVFVWNTPIYTKPASEMPEMPAV